MAHFFKIISLLILVSTSVFVCFYKLGQYPLERWDELTNANVVYDTIESRQSLVPHLNGKPFFEKPPLWYQLTMFSTQIFGYSNFSLRFISALSGFSLIIITFYSGWKMFSYWSGILAGFTMLSIKQLFVTNVAGIFSTHTLRSADIDSLQLLFIMLTVFAFFQFSNVKTKSFFWIIIAGIFSGFALLTKGPFAFLPALLFFSFLVINSIKNHLSNTSNKQIIKLAFIFCITFFLVIAPWHLYMVVNFREAFIHEYLTHHILARSFTTIENHSEGIFYYFKFLFDPKLSVLGILLILATIMVIRYQKNRIVSSFEIYAPFMGTFLTFVIISLIQTKLAWYILPVYPFLALLIGGSFVYVSQRVTPIGSMLQR